MITFSTILSSIESILNSSTQIICVPIASELSNARTLNLASAGKTSVATLRDKVKSSGGSAVAPRADPS